MIKSLIFWKRKKKNEKKYNKAIIIFKKFRQGMLNLDKTVVLNKQQCRAVSKREAYGRPERKPAACRCSAAVRLPRMLDTRLMSCSRCQQ